MKVARVIFGLLAGVGLFSAAASARAEDAAQVAYQLSWIANPADAPLLLGIEKSYYKDAGVTVRWEPGKGAFNTVQVVGSGTAQFGTADASAVLRGIASGIPIIAVAIYLQKTPSAIIATPDIKKPKDLEGKKLATVSTTATARLFPAFAEVNGIDMTKVEVIEASQSTQMPLFLSGKVDALDGFTIGEWVEVQQIGKPASLIKWSDYGLNMYGNALIANRDFAAANPELVKKVVKATMRGMQYALAHPEDAVDTTKKVSAVKLETLRSQWKEIAELMESPDTAQHGLGWMTQEGWENVQRLNLQYGGQKVKLPMEQIFTTQFLE